MTKYSETTIGAIVSELLEREAKGKREAAYGRALCDVMQMYANLDESMSLINKTYCKLHSFTGSETESDQCDDCKILDPRSTRQP